MAGGIGSRFWPLSKDNYPKQFLDILGIGDAGCCVAPCRLAEHLVGTEHGQMFQHEMFVCLVGHYEEVLVRNDGAKALVGAANKALACA